MRPVLLPLTAPKLVCASASCRQLKWSRRQKQANFAPMPFRLFLANSACQIQLAHGRFQGSNAVRHETQIAWQLRFRVDPEVRRVLDARSHGAANHGPAPQSNQPAVTLPIFITDTLSYEARKHCRHCRQMVQLLTTHTVYCACVKGLLKNLLGCISATLIDGKLSHIVDEEHSHLLIKGPQDVGR